MLFTTSNKPGHPPRPVIKAAAGYNPTDTAFKPTRREVQPVTNPALPMCWLFNAAQDTYPNAVANIEGAVTQAVLLDEVPAVVKDGVDEERGTRYETGR